MKNLVLIILVAIVLESKACGVVNTQPTTIEDLTTIGDTGDVTEETSQSTTIEDLDASTTIGNTGVFTEETSQLTTIEETNGSTTVGNTGVVTEVTTQQPTIEDLCDGFTIIFNGKVGVKEDDECDKVRICYIQNNETNEIVRRTVRCRYGTFWNQTLLKCDNISDVDCPNDPCRNLSSYKTNGKCYQYYICEDGKTKVASCPYGQSYPPGQNQHCQYNSSCEHPGEPCSYPYIRSYKKGGKCYEFYLCVNGRKQKRICPNKMSYPSGVNKHCVVNYGCRRFPYDPCRSRYLRSYKKSGKCYEYYLCKSGRSWRAFCPNRMYYPVGSNKRCMRSRRCKRKSFFNLLILRKKLQSLRNKFGRV